MDKSVEERALPLVPQVMADCPDPTFKWIDNLLCSIGYQISMFFVNVYKPIVYLSLVSRHKSGLHRRNCGRNGCAPLQCQRVSQFMWLSVQTLVDAGPQPSPRTAVRAEGNAQCY